VRAGAGGRPYSARRPATLYALLLPSMTKGQSKRNTTSTSTSTTKKLSVLVSGQLAFIDIDIYKPMALVLGTSLPLKKSDF
jgi:hypothetical protein